MRRLACLALIGLSWAAPASGQWFGAAYLGSNYTHPADVIVTQPARGTALTFERVEFDARPFESPQYYGLRIGRLFGETRRYGLEIELIHLKVIGRTDREYGVSGMLDGAPLTDRRPMEQLVQRYSMTHGLNYLLINAVGRQPIGEGRVALVGRFGVGPTYPHAETTVGGVAREQYEIAGPGVHLSAGADLRLAGRLSAMAEYKLTGSRPTISIADGSGRMRAVTQQIAVGLSYGIGR